MKVRVAVKTENRKGLSYILKTSISQQPHSSLRWRNAPYPSRTYTAIPLARGILPRHNKTGRPNPGTSTSDTWRISETKVSEHNSISYWDEAAVRSLWFPARPPHITAEYSAGSRNRKRRARVSLHIQNEKPQARIKNKIEKIHKLFDVYNAIHKRWR